MAVAKKSIAAFVKERTVDRIGLVVFAGEASTWVPLTLDYSLLASLLDDVDIGMLARRHGDRQRLRHRAQSPA